MIQIDEKHFSELTSKYSGVNMAKIKKEMKEKCEYYENMDKEKREIFGFENGKKFEFNNTIKDSILLVDDEMKVEKRKKESEEEQKQQLYEVYEEIIEKLRYYCDIEEKYYSLIAIW